jgi:hypothetical protein
MLREERPWYLLWQSAKARAKERGVLFTLTAADVQAVWPSDGRCPALGVELRRSTSGDHRYAPESPSIDKIVPRLGYVPGNIAVISMKANRLKHDETSPDALRLVADWIERVCVKG